MNRLVTIAVLFALAASSGCSFVMKEYDARNEKKLAALDEENKALTSKVRTLERKVPELDQHLKELESDNKKLRSNLSDIDTKISTLDIEEIESMDLNTAQPAPAPEPEMQEAEEPFTLSETAEAEENKPEVQAPKSKLTPEAARIMEMAKKGDSSEMAEESEETAVPVPTSESTPKPEAPPEESGSKSKLTPDAERIMALAQQKAGAEEPASTVPIPAPEPEPKPEPKPEPSPEPTAKAETSTDQAAQKSKLTPEAQRILAMARGEEYKSEVAEPKAQPETQPATGAAKPAIAQAFKLKVLGGTGSITLAKKMAKTLEGMGYKAESISLAPRSNFDRNTVYYAKGYESTAEDLKKKLGGKTITKALSWKSEFDIIVVSAE